VTLNTIELKEAIEMGQRVIRFDITGSDNLKDLKPIASGTTIGHKRIIQFPTQTLKMIRLKVNEYKAPPLISSIKGYLIPN